MRSHNSTIKLKKKICIGCGIPSYIFSKGRCQSCARIDGAAKSDEKEHQIEFSGLVDDLDAIFSKYIRHKYADIDGLVKCYTCPSVEPIGMIQNGHYISRQHMFLRWDERQCRPQCAICNNLKRGNLSIFKNNLESENFGITDILQEESRMVYKWSREELKSLIGEYSRKLKLLQK
jgi:hypothetical protein